MELYKHGGDYDRLTVSYSLEIESNRLHTAYTDWHAMDGLARLITGGVRSTSDLLGAELAIRSIVFHENIIESIPSIRLYIKQKDDTEVILDAMPKMESREFMSHLMKTGNFQRISGGIEHLVTFAQGVNIQEFLEKRKKRRMKEKEKLDKLGMPPPSLDIDFENGPLDLIANNPDSFFEDQFSRPTRYTNNFLAPICASGAATYISHPKLLQDLRKYRSYNAEEFFGVIDKNWAEWGNRLQRALDIKVPPFLSILLSRSSSRHDIPNQLIGLRDEYNAPRLQLWGLFEDADHIRMGDLIRSAQILSDIEKQASQILPNMYAPQQDRFPIIEFNLLGRLLFLNHLGVLKEISKELLSRLNGKMAQIDAAHITSNALRTVEIRGLLGRFLSPQELQALQSEIPGIPPSERSFVV